MENLPSLVTPAVRNGAGSLPVSSFSIPRRCSTPSSMTNRRRSSDMVSRQLGLPRLQRDHLPSSRPPSANSSCHTSSHPASTGESVAASSFICSSLPALPSRPAVNTAQDETNETRTSALIPETIPSSLVSIVLLCMPSTSEGCPWWRRAKVAVAGPGRGDKPNCRRIIARCAHGSKASRM